MLYKFVFLVKKSAINPTSSIGKDEQNLPRYRSKLEREYSKAESMYKEL
tara:strand:+ start:4101 stop:4247 length:147 start_codon:yes stop_codon:yes gene_type:complete